MTTINLPLNIIEYSASDIYSIGIPNKNVSISYTESNLVRITVNAVNNVLDRTPGIIIKNVALYADAEYRLSIKGFDYSGGDLCLYAGSVFHGTIYMKTSVPVNLSTYNGATFKPTHALTDIGVLFLNARKNYRCDILQLKLQKISNDSDLINDMGYKFSNFITLDTYQTILENKKFNSNLEINGLMNINSTNANPDNISSDFEGININCNSDSGDINIGNVNNTLNVYSNLKIKNTTQASNITSDYLGALVISGGINVVKNCIINSTTNSTDINNGSLITAGGVGIAQSLTVGGKIEVLRSVYASDSVYAALDIYQRGYLLSPPGLIMAYAGSSAPNGYLLCNGASYSRTTYFNLFLVIGTTYGNIDSVSFNVPDLRDKFVMTKGSVFSSLGTTGGTTSIALTTNELPTHAHGASSASAGDHYHTGTTSTNGTHSHTGRTNEYCDTPESESAASSGIGSVVVSGSYQRQLSLNIDSNGDHTHTFTSNTTGAHTHDITINSTGNGAAFSLMNPYIIMNYIIKT